MNTKLKYFLYDNHLLIVLVFIVIIFVGWLNFETLNTPEFLVSAIGAFLGISYFLLKQQLEETRLFQELFTAFNERYDNLNEPLSRLLRESEKLTQEQEEKLCDYFNLCAEEYLYFERGFIPPKVWAAWLNGMKAYLKDERISAFWLKEALTESYYGLEKHLEKGRNHSCPAASPISTVAQYG